MYYENENDQNRFYQGSEENNGAIEPIVPAVGGVGKGPKKERRGIKMVALALCCALLGGTVGAGIVYRSMEENQSKQSETEINVSSRQVAEVKQVKVDGKKQLTMQEVYQANVNSVVSINVYAQQNVFGQTVENAASGSGFIITEDGFIVTNYHVVEGASEVKVTLYSGETYDATIIGGDEDYDIAVLKIDGESFTPVVFGDSSELQIGETIAAIGNPLGELTFSMSQGIVSCVDRAINVEGTPFNMIQVDCSINPGNSGGPLVNTYGEVIGIVSAKYSTYSSTTVEGIGFAIPINDVIAMIEDIMTNGFVTNKPYLGISAGTLTASLAQQYRYEITEGVLIYAVDEGGAAEKAGLRMGDVITKIGEDEITSLEDLTAVKKKYTAGDTVVFEIYRDRGKLRVEFTFDTAPATTMEEKEPEQQPNDYNGNGGYYYYNPWDYFFNRGYYSYGSAA